MRTAAKTPLAALTGLALSLGVAGAALADRTPAPDGAQVYFVNLKDGDVVSSPVTVVFGLRGMGVAPAGVDKEKTGHHHLLINRPAFGDGPDGAAEVAEGIPADDNHLHFGGGQTEASVELPAGQHSLQLVLGDQNHVPHDAPIVSQRITITVK